MLLGSGEGESLNLKNHLLNNLRSIHTPNEQSSWPQGLEYRKWTTDMVFKLSPRWLELEWCPRLCDFGPRWRSVAKLTPILDRTYVQSNIGVRAA